eukprot:TRINITY_DN2135_c0_g1_i3.p1 TRINITY_DN2135_c0_g1~~TRINITY_DN2135_c0_g1_i3.p1  ORF type:complete len:1138 (+),score=324.53 TRINITY_DN2135_c0_g1_i3:43-3456(+)
MEDVPERISFPGEEEKTLKYWDEIKAFETCLKQSEGKPEFSFYDGPPFATGLPHYGHLLAGTIKDVVTRYAHQTGHHVPRRFGWDCHGLPIEFEIDKIHGIKTRDDVLAMGIPKYNKLCRDIVMKYSTEWEAVVKRLGRWIDMKNNYKTMDLSFMESVWWVFKQMHEKDLVYRGFKVMPYSTSCTTPLSNFEANMAYKEVSDPAVYVSFPLEGEERALIAWTTTPWTLPSNLALCVNPDMEYTYYHDVQRKKDFIIMTERLAALYKNPAKDIQVKGTMKGQELAGKKYKPLFNYFLKEAEKGAFTVVTDTYVTAESGTGVVHCAPAFGEDDYRVCVKSGIVVKGADIVCPVDPNGRFTSDVKDFANVYVKDADKEIIQTLKKADRLVQAGSIVHSYPFCWRSDTPLIYKAVPSWFVKVESFKDRLLENNKKSRWVPEFVQEKRFHNWLKDARDWAISRNRYWGTPLPVWTSENYDEIVVIGSVAELEELSGVKVHDLHRETVDDIVIISKKTGNKLRRIEEVFDCWFESGSMPYAQQHYPFENKDLFEKVFPADFIAEGLDQTRGWFYTLLVIAVALFDKPPFKNLIVNGLVLAADGKKMSKRLKNYPDPKFIFDEYGSDALRLYMVNSPVVRAETLKFNEKGVKDIIKDVFLPWFNAYRFFVQNALRLQKAEGKQFEYNAALSLSSDNVMDKWILASLQSLILFVRQEMEAYRLYTVLPKLVSFINQLTNWYVRLNRRRIKGTVGEKDAHLSLNILFEVLLNLCKVMAPFTPFFTEYMYRNLSHVLPASQRKDSVHYEEFPQARKEALNPAIETAVGHMQEVIELGRAARDRRKLPVKTPLMDIRVVHPDIHTLTALGSLQNYIVEELNVRTVSLTSEEGTYVSIRAEPEREPLGKRFKKLASDLGKAIQALSHGELKDFLAKGSIDILGNSLSPEEVRIVREFKGDKTRYEAAWSSNILTILDCYEDEELKSEGLYREVVNRVQRLRKKAGLQPGDPVELFYQVGENNNNSALAKSIKTHQAKLFTATTVHPIPYSERTLPAVNLLTEKYEVDGEKLELSLANYAFHVNPVILKQKYGADAEDVATALLSRDYTRTADSLQGNQGIIKFVLNGKPVELKEGEDFFRTAAQKLHLV